MADNTKFYVVRGDKVLIESMSKEEIHNAIIQAVEQGEIGDIDKGFITSVVEQNQNVNLKFWRGTQSQYHRLPSIDPNTYYIITDDSFEHDVNEQIAILNNYCDSNDRRITALENEKYESGETWTLGGSTIYVNGTITGSKQNIHFLLPLPKQLIKSYVTSVAIDSCKFIARQAGNYVVGTSTTSVACDSATGDITPYGISINAHFDTAISAATNNAEIALEISELDIIFS